MRKLTSLTVKLLFRVLPGVLILIGMSERLSAHPMPNSVILLNVHANRIEAEVQIPLNELQAAFGHAVNDSSAGLVARLGSTLRKYLKEHIHAESAYGKNWKVLIGSLHVQETENPINGVYRELSAKVQLIPPLDEDIRHFTLYYDAVLHQVVTHKILVSVNQDWQQGLVANAPAMQVGIISLDIVNNKVLPLAVSLESGSIWKGFQSMVKLGIDHIAGGTDHLLFLLVLLLPAPLLVSSGRWAKFGGVRYSLKRLLSIVTAFTAGHSLTLLLGSLGWIKLPGQPIEVLISISILVSAIHAIRPIFSGKEAAIAAGFGLIHGLAFAGTLASLSLDPARMALSILGFNLGIEMMQLLVIVMTIPWLIMLSKTSAYEMVRSIGALLAAIAAIAWLVERVTNHNNLVTTLIERLVSYAPFALGILIVSALFLTWRTRQIRQIH